MSGSISALKGTNMELVNGRLRKIPRPMNAFMFFAHENRRKFQDQFPDESNSIISQKLGIAWRELSEDSKKRFYDLSKRADIEHKLKYPNYQYSPGVARKNKQARIEERNRQQYLKNEAIQAYRKGDRTVFNVMSPTSCVSETSGVRQMLPVRNPSPWGMPPPMQGMRYMSGSPYNFSGFQPMSFASRPSMPYPGLMTPAVQDLQPSPVPGIQQFMQPPPAGTPPDGRQQILQTENMKNNPQEDHPGQSESEKTAEALASIAPTAPVMTVSQPGMQTMSGDPYRYSPYGPIVYVPCDVSYAAKLGWDPETLPRPPRPNAPIMRPPLPPRYPCDQSSVHYPSLNITNNCSYETYMPGLNPPTAQLVQSVNPHESANCETNIQYIDLSQSTVSNPGVYISACDDNSLKENTEDGAKGESGEAASQLILGSGDYHGDLRSNEQGIRNQMEDYQQHGPTGDGATYIQVQGIDDQVTSNDNITSSNSADDQSLASVSDVLSGVSVTMSYSAPEQNIPRTSFAAADSNIPVTCIDAYENSHNAPINVVDAISQSSASEEAHEIEKNASENYIILSNNCADTEAQQVAEGDNNLKADSHIKDENDVE